MTPLERLGLEVVAFTLIGSRAQAAVLCALLDAEGRFLEWDQIGAARPWKMGAFEVTAGAIKTRISLLRDALEDLGFAGVIQTAGRKEGMRYALPDPGRAQIIARLVAEAAR